MALTPQQISDKWARNLGAATATIEAGVASVQTAPGERAAARQDAWLEGIQRSASSGKWRSRVRSVTLQEWKSSMTQKGIPRIATGASNAKPKFTEFMGEFMPHIEAGLRTLETMPRGDLAMNIQRAITMIEHNATFRRSG